MYNHLRIENMKYSDLYLKRMSSLEQNKQSNKYKKDPKIKVAIDVLGANMRTNFYQKICQLTETKPKTWRKLEFLLDENQIETFIGRIKKEIELVKNSKFDYHKYRNMIIRILGKNSDKLSNNQTIVKNMFIAKLTNIIILLRETIEDSESSIKNVKNANKDILR